MLENSDPWKDIPTTNEDEKLVVKKISNHPYEWYKATNSRNEYIFKFSGKFSPEELKKKIPKFRYINITIQPESDDIFSIIISLTEKGQLENFRIVCNDLLNITKNIPDNDNQRAAEEIINKLRKWSELFQKEFEKKKNSSEILGLIGELLFLEELFKVTEYHTAIQSWKGYHGDEQDFSHSGIIIEIKTKSSSKDNSVTINSENQLDTVSGEIFLVVKLIDTSDKNKTDAFSLTSLIKRIINKLSSDNNISIHDEFMASLMKLSFGDWEKYDHKYYIAKNTLAYQVTEKFPKIVASDIPKGISKVRYDISLIDIESFSIEFEEVLNKWNH